MPIRRTRSLLFGLLVFAAASPPLFAASLCGTGQTGSPLFCGDVWKMQAGGPLVLAPSGYRVDICNQFPCGGTVYSAFTDANGHWETSQTVLGCTLGGEQPWYIFVSSVEDWGSRDYPVQTVQANTTCGLQRITTYVPPGPHRPQPVSPANNSTLYTTAISLVWQNSIDSLRDDPSWPAWYDLYVKSWPLGTTQPTSYPPPTQVVCGAGTATCSYSLQLTDGTNYQWKVTAHMDVTKSIVHPVVPSIIFSNAGSYVYFSTATGRPPGCCRF